MCENEELQIETAMIINIEYKKVLMNHNKKEITITPYLPRICCADIMINSELVGLKW